MSLWTGTGRRAKDAAVTHDIRSAYDKGRRDERASRKRHPFFMGGMMLLAAVGASMLTLAAINGSFSGGGAVADATLAGAAQSATPVVEGAVERTGEAAREAGSDLKDKGKALVSRDKS